jgi:hypothetical protein
MPETGSGKRLIWQNAPAGRRAMSVRVRDALCLERALSYTRGSRISCCSSFRAESSLAWPLAAPPETSCNGLAY